MPRRAVAAATLLLVTLSGEGCTRQLVLPAPGDITLGEDAGRDTGTVTDGGRFNLGRDSGSDARSSCRVKQLGPNPIPVNVVWMVGRNPSMKQAFGAKLETTRIQAVTQAIRGASADYPDAISFGYLSFPGIDPQGGCGAGCCVDSPVAPSAVTNDAIERALAPCDSGLDTRGCISPIPMDNRPMVSAFEHLFNVFPDTGSRNVILFADSPPGCGNDNGQACDSVQARVQTLLQERKTNLFVIPIVEDVDCLKMIALQGGQGPTAPVPPVPVATTADLSRSLTSILRNVASPYCTFDLSQTPMDKNDVQLLLDGVMIDKDSGTGDGWSFQGKSSTTIEVHGAACTGMLRLPSKLVKVQEVFLCTP